jgi:hypothetical protein
MRRFLYFFTLLVRLNIFALNQNEKFQLSSRWTNIECLIYVLIIVHMATTELINDNTILNKQALLRLPALSVGRGQQTNQKKEKCPLHPVGRHHRLRCCVICRLVLLSPSLSYAPVAPTLRAVARSSGGRC